MCAIFSESLIGKGGSSRVYRGCLPGGQELAVKILKPSEDVLKQFVSEIEIISSLDHKNVISLVGFCFEEGKLLLVYNLLSRGSLEDNLHGTHISFFLHISVHCLAALDQLVIVCFSITTLPIRC